MSGKWHVTRHIKPNSDSSNWPLQRGFDQFYGTIIGAGSFYDPATLCRGNRFITPENDPDYQPEEFHYTEAISDNAVRFLKQHQENNAEDPFFLYVAYTSAHWPMHAPESIIKKYRGNYDEGYQPVRNARYRQAIQKGVIESEWDMSTTAVNWEKFPHKEWDSRCMEVYAAMVDQMDQGIGRIIKQLEVSDTLDNTLVIYLQDNGGCAEGFGRRSNLDKASTFPPLGKDGLQTKIWPPMQTRDGRWVGTGPDVMPGPEDSFVAYGKGWANTSNTPFRGYKHDAYEGGISTPMIAHWPAGIPKAAHNRVVNSPSHLIDIMPTLVEVAKSGYPTQFNSSQILPMEGVSLVKSFHGKPLNRKMPICFEHHGNCALRDGRWKVVSQYKKDSEREWELYDMEADRTELTDLSEQHPERLAKMKQQWQSWADRVGVQKWPFKNKN